MDKFFEELLAFDPPIGAIIWVGLLSVYYGFWVGHLQWRCFKTKKEALLALIPFFMVFDMLYDRFKELK